MIGRHAPAVAASRLIVAAAAVAIVACAPATDLQETGASQESTRPTARPATSGPFGSGAGAGIVVVDLSLLDVLPADVEGVAIEADPASSDSVSRDPALAGEVEAIGMGLAVDAESEGANLAIASVVRLRSGVFSDAFFRNWRDSYDEAACAQAGGVTGNAETEIGGRRVFIGSCTGGAHTYHTVARDDVLVSITAVGEKRLGEKIVAGIRS